MMTPEQMQNTMQFIVENHANAMIRMDRFDEELKKQKEEIDRVHDAISKQTGHNSQVEQILKTVIEMLASQSQRLQWLEDRNQ